MTVDEIFADVGTHMVKGLMLHEELANYYDFLGLKGYMKCHEYHYLLESWNLRKLNTYYIKHYGKLIPNVKVDTEEIVPTSWYRYEQVDVDTNTKRNAIKSAIEKWLNWETETKRVYQRSYLELIELGEVGTAVDLFINLIKDVDDELIHIRKINLNKKSTGYEICSIESEQHDKYCKYKEKIEHIGEQYKS